MLELECCIELFTNYLSSQKALSSYVGTVYQTEAHISSSSVSPLLTQTVTTILLYPIQFLCGTPYPLTLLARQVLYVSAIFPGALTDLTPLSVLV